ncbi:vasotab-like isoform X2 [Drosophila innubila]|uniref:vasotab-like isoform X2 n=1 Tax=Drosophila innubila TaxID=198719 RepID=UPI00148B46FE|nr:vasotab-like isoform X2 [Drosophila innubila]
MKFCVALISLVICATFVMAQDNCPTICTADFKPVCGEATVDGQSVRCQFSNACKMGVSACVNKINWLQTSCGYGTSPTCGSLI